MEIIERPAAVGAKQIFHSLSIVATVLFAFFLPISTSLSNVLLAVAAGSTLLTGDIKAKLDMIVSQPINLCFVALFLIYAVGLTYTSADFSVGAAKLMVFDKFLFAVLLYPMFASNKNLGRYAINAFLLAMVLTLALSYLKAMGLINYNLRFGNAAVFKDYIKTSFAMAICCYFLACRIYTEKSYRRIYSALLILFLHNIFFLERARSGYVIIFVLAVLVLWQLYTWRGVLVATVLIGLLAGLAFIFSNTFHTRILEVQQNIQQYHSGNAATSIGQRLRFADAGLSV